MNFILAANQNKQTQVSDSFENSTQTKKPLINNNNKSSFSDNLDKAQNRLSNDRVSSQNVHSRNDNIATKNTDKEVTNFDDLESYGKNEKGLEQGRGENSETLTSAVEQDRSVESSSNLDSTNVKKVGLYTDDLELLHLEMVAVAQQLNTQTNVDLTALVEQINLLIEQINTSDSFDANLTEDFENIVNVLQDLGLSFTNILNSNISRDTMISFESSQNNFVASLEKLNTLVKDMGENLALVENIDSKNAELCNEIKSLSNKINQVVESDEMLNNAAISENVNAKTATGNEMFVNNLEASKEYGLENKANRKLERDENNALQANNNSISGEKATEFTIVQAKDGIMDMMDNPLNSRSNALANQAKVNINSSIDIMNKFQDMISTIVERAKMTISDGRTDMIMSLRPENLGNVRMKMTVEGDNLIAKIFVDSSEVKDIFTKNLDTIISSLKELNVNIEGFDVSLNQNSDNASFGEQDDGEFSIGGVDANFGATDVNINDTVTIATQLFPERQLNIVI